VIGEFVWTGFDYLGEPTPYDGWPSRSSYFGINDLGFAWTAFTYTEAVGIPRDQPFISCHIGTGKA
jgi:hypothetical protein